MLTPRRIRQLLREPESNTLDFKTDQYAFAKATDEQKSEIIKDILAFANTPRITDAHILLGVKEHKGCVATITGITDHPDDAHLQQLINTKTNRPVQFTYEPLTIDGKTIGIIRIPPQERLAYLRKDYGKLRANTVYLRHGSSTAIATPDEIARMGTPDAPALDLQFGDHNERQLQGNHLAIESTVLQPPDNIPDYGVALEFFEFNRDYYREFITYATFDQLTTPIGLSITNTSTVTAHGVCITLTIPDVEHCVTLALDAPLMPDQLDMIEKPKAKKPPLKRAVTLKRTSTAWYFTATIQKVQPRQTHYLREKVYIGASKSTTLKITGTIHADNLPEPITTSFTIAVKSRQHAVTLIEALAHYNLD